jgi:hypothetical protein
MKYQFKAEVWNDTKSFTVDSEHGLLNNLGGLKWTPEKVQVIIDMIKNAKTSENTLTWTSEDLTIDADDESVYFYDLMARRAGSVNQGEDLELNPSEFIEFLYDFKKFIEENS